jgi:hypothetical protein
MARILAERVAEVLWGPEAAQEFTVENDRDIRAAVQIFPELEEKLRGHGR